MGEHHGGRERSETEIEGIPPPFDCPTKIRARLASWSYERESTGFHRERCRKMLTTFFIFWVKTAGQELCDDKSKKRVHSAAIAKCSLLTLLCCSRHSRSRGNRLLARNCRTRTWSRLFLKTILGSKGYFCFGVYTSAVRRGLEGALDEKFDDVTPPDLPPFWMAINGIDPDGVLWQTSYSGFPSPPYETAPNAAWVNDPPVISDKSSMRQRLCHGILVRAVDIPA